VVTVAATRTERDVLDTPSVATVIDAEQIENNLVSDIKDLIRFEPGVAVRSSPARFSAAFSSTGRDGNAGFNIRGLEGNRVLFTVDGVRLPDGFSFGPAAFGRGDYVDLDLLRSVEIVRGPASALYGSDGLAGAVSFTTKDPDDSLDGEENFGARVRVAYASADESWSEGVSLAGRSGNVQGLIAYTRRDGRELQNQGDNNSFDSSRTAPNPQDAESNALAAKLVLTPWDGHRLRLTYDYGDRRVETEGYTGRAAPPYAASSVIDLDGLDESDRQRIAFDHRFDLDSGPVDRGFWTLYYQESHVLQFADEDRYTSADRIRSTSFDNSVWGAALQLESAFIAGGGSHRLIYGGDYSQTRQEGVRDGTVPPIGESFPVRAFPNTDYTLAGLFVQDEIELFDGVVTLFPALRYDAYELEPAADALYPSVTAGQSDSHLSPKFGVTAWPSERVGLFFNYAEGFKAPAPSQVNNFFENPIFGYTSIPNPDLEPETSQSFEAGLRWRGQGFAGAYWRAELAGFSAEYENFISQQVVSGSGAPGDPLVFQFINLSAAEISGAEARASASWDNGVGLNLAASFAEGEQTSFGVTAPLDSIEPVKLVAGVSYDDPSGAFGAQAVITHSAQPDEHQHACKGVSDDGNHDRPDEFVEAGSRCQRTGWSDEWRSDDSSDGGGPDDETDGGCASLDDPHVACRVPRELADTAAYPDSRHAEQQNHEILCSDGEHDQRGSHYGNGIPRGERRTPSCAEAHPRQNRRPESHTKGSRRPRKTRQRGRAGDLLGDQCCDSGNSDVRRRPDRVTGEQSPDQTFSR
jgi:hemoglobin/transferrin/lactoferrin receptor protein